MDYSKRSDSSAPLRTHLKSNLASLPEISNKVTVTSYIRLCHSLYTSAQNAYNQGDLKRSYVDLYKFQILALKMIPTHKDYKSKAPIAVKMRVWLEKTLVPAIQLLEVVVYKLDFEEDQRIKHSTEYDLIDEFDCEERETLPKPTAQPSVASSCPEQVQASAPHEEIVFTAPRDASKLSVLAHSGEVDTVQAPSHSAYNVPQFAFPEDPSELPLSPLSVTAEDKAILQYIGDYRRYAVPQPAVSTVDVHIGTKHYLFYQDDFHTSFSGFLSTLPPELQLARSAVEVNRCFFIHLGIAIGVHPFALQCAFRYMATLASETAEEWQKEILASVCLYGALVDANMLCFLWPRELNPYRVCFISGPLTKPLVSSFEPPPSVLLGNTSSENPADSLTEVIIRCSGDHFTLLRPVNPQPGSSGGNSPKGFQVISPLLRDAREAKLVTQVSQAQEPEKERSISEAFAHL